MILSNWIFISCSHTGFFFYPDSSVTSLGISVYKSASSFKGATTLFFFFSDLHFILLFLFHIRLLWLRILASPELRFKSSYPGPSKLHGQAPSFSPSACAVRMLASQLGLYCV